MRSKGKIFFITGAFVNTSCWDNWKLFFHKHGYTIQIPIWPHKDESNQVLLKRHPDLVLGQLSLEELFQYFVAIIEKEQEKPIVIGHSLGGLIVQYLLQENLASLGVAIHSIPPKGIYTLHFSLYKSLWNPLGFFKYKNTTHLMSFKDWQYAYTNGMTLKEQKDSYEKYIIPESRRVLRDLLTVTAKIAYKKKLAPLLFIAGEKDHMMPASLNYLNYKKYRKNTSITNYKEFEEINHFVLGQQKWQEIAAYCLNWIEQNNTL
ncbi:alpha/beta hydrolase [Cellulophaga baltica]|uniref:alpha/beta hydrolase n=1 Tax=Cellulophaga baltica TaxID=76594 RepID=UPI0024955958|nr:alpha/beta hydrolase [Cellulophaga baltica]